ncbi:dihydrofolate reductase isoform X1 [Macaca thibetana thibetana]|uniref:dihydrofolate reductase isoform X1 n=1 Tax=Macaca thibetana thibetana TaxID=257877 RepID=UPI0021BC97CF|nr:dihydrofolate reductase isoform X1 [Macaca thibetana thibetana]
MAAREQGPAGSASPRPQFPGVCGREPAVTLPCAGAGGGASPAQIGTRGRGGHNFAPILTARSVLTSGLGGAPAAVMVRSLNCIVAVSQNMGIGKNGDLPWPLLRNEFRYFQRMTTTSSVEGKQNLVIMGKKTWFSIPEKNRPLKGRINLVLSRELKEPPQGAHFLARSLDDALKLTEQPELANKVDMIWIVGGSSVYKEAMNHPGHLKLFVTRIMQDFESDTFLPEIDLEKYKLLPEYPGVLSDVQEEKGIKYKFEVYEKND